MVQNQVLSKQSVADKTTVQRRKWIAAEPKAPEQNFANVSSMNRLPSQSFQSQNKKTMYQSASSSLLPQSNLV